MLKKQNSSCSSLALNPKQTVALVFLWMLLEQFLGVAKWHTGELGLMNRELGELETLEFKAERTPALCIGTRLEEMTESVSLSHLVSLSKGQLSAYSWRRSSHSQFPGGNKDCAGHQRPFWRLVLGTRRKAKDRSNYLCTGKRDGVFPALFSSPRGSLTDAMHRGQPMLSSMQETRT